jgi:CRP-like cAMP-binding protein
VFKSVEKKPLLELARSGCTLCNVRINNYVYREGEKPDAVYIILEGSVKVERSGYSDRTQDIVVMSPEALIGDQDICFAQREANTICCSAESRLLKIPKK